MPVLSNPAHEKFCQYYVTYGVAGKAYAMAYGISRGDSANSAANKLKKKETIKKRIQEIQDEAMEAMNPANIMRMLNQATLMHQITPYLDDDGCISMEEIKDLPDALQRLITKLEITERKTGEMQSDKKYKIEFLSKEFALKQSFELYKFLAEQKEKGKKGAPKGYTEGALTINVSYTNNQNNSDDEQEENFGLDMEEDN